MGYVSNPGLLASAFIEGSAAFILLVLYALLAPSFKARFFRYWLAGWTVYVFLQALDIGFILRDGTWNTSLRFPISLAMAILLFVAVLECCGQRKHLMRLLPWFVIAASGCIAIEFVPRLQIAAEWGQSSLECLLYLSAGWALWRTQGRHRGVGWNLLAGAFLLRGLHGFDRPNWSGEPFFLFRVSFHGLFLIAAGIAMAVLVLEAGRTRNEDLNEKLRRLSLITVEATRSFRVDKALDGILRHLLENLGASSGAVLLFDEMPDSSALVLRASVGFGEGSLERYRRLSSRESWVQTVLDREKPVIVGHSTGASTPRWLQGREGLEGIATEILVRIPGSDAPLGLLSIGFSAPRMVEIDEEQFLANVANLLGLTVQNVELFESAAVSRRQWRDAFDSIDDLIVIHSNDGRILRTNRAFAENTRIEPAQAVGKYVRDVLRRGVANWVRCPYCEGAAGKAEEIDPSFGRYFLATNSTLHDSKGGRLGTIHVLRDLTSKRQAESRFRDLFEKAQEGAFICTLEGRLLDCNAAFTRIFGYDDKEELLRVYTPEKFYVDPDDHRRLKSLLEEYGELAGFEARFRRGDGEIRIARLSAVATRDESGAAIAYQGFLLDSTERKQAEMEVRRRNRELLALNAIGEMLNQSSKLGEGLSAALKKVLELFDLDVAALHFLDDRGNLLKPSVSVGCQSEWSRPSAPPILVSPAFLEQVAEAHATLFSGSAPALPQAFRELQRSEGVLAAQLVVLWAKNRVMGTLLVGCRKMREFSAAELNTLSAVGNQIATTVDKSLLLEETREAYDSLRLTQEQLLQSEKMAAVGQLIAGVAHELNNPLTAILGYSQLLQSGELAGPRGADYLEKLYKQAQRTHRIVQSLLSFSRQHKPERTPVQINQILHDTLILREYDIKTANVRLHRDFDPNLPLTGGDFHQLQQVFLNILNNAVDAVSENDGPGDIWIRTKRSGDRLCVEFANNGPTVQNPHRIFDPFYTTKPVGKGTGLGLSICYGIVKEHGGEIHVHNSPPRGATFTILLPVTPVHSAPLAPQPSAACIPTSKVLLVEGEEAVLQVEREILQARGIAVASARSGWEAMDILKEGSVRAAVLDMRIPGNVPAPALYRWIERNRPEIAMRVIFTASNGDDSENTEALRETGRPLLKKPFSMENFWETIQNALNAEVPAPLNP